MESRFQVCATPERFQKFFKHATSIVQSEIPADVRRSCIIEDLKSPSLRRQWARFNNGRVLPTPDAWEVCYGFLDVTGWLTAEKLESVAADVVADLQPRWHRAPHGEAVPWAVAMTTEADGRALAAITHRYPALTQVSLLPSA